MLEWSWKQYSALSKHELFLILKARQEVFIVEQECAYLDVDGLDAHAWHLFASQLDQTGTPEICAYLRVIFPGYRYREASIGRVLTTLVFRRSGLGKQLLQRSLDHLDRELPGQPIRISAQQYLEKFYTDFGFKSTSTPYLEDGIPHIEMLRKGERRKDGNLP